MLRLNTVYYYENYISISSKCHITNKCLELNMYL